MRLLSLIGLSMLAVASLAALRPPAHAYDATAFVMRVKTDNPGTSSSTQFTIPTVGTGYNYDVDCDDDGTIDHTGVTGSVTCTYPSAGEYTIAITGDFPRIYFNNTGDREKLLEVRQWGDIEWSSMASAFYGASNLRVAATDAPDLGAVTDMSYMFSEAYALNDDISGWDTSSVTNMSNTFASASAFNQPIGGWNTSSVTDMSGMFYFATSFNQPIGSWDTSGVTNMQHMFAGATAFNQSIGSLDMSSVIYAYGMLTRSGTSTSTYDSTLQGFAEQELQQGVIFGGADPGYCLASEARQTLIDTFSWNITDGGQNCGLRLNGEWPIKVITGTPAGPIGVLDTEGRSIRQSNPYELACTTPGADDDLFSIEIVNLISTVDLDRDNPLDVNEDSIYEVCIRIHLAGGGHLDQLIKIEVIVPKVITGVEFTEDEGKAFLTAIGGNLLGEHDQDLSGLAFFYKSFVSLNGKPLGFCPEALGGTAADVIEMYGVDPALVSDDPPCYLILNSSGTAYELTGAQAKIWLPDDFDTTATGTVSVNGSNVFTFNPGATPEEPTDPDDPEDPVDPNPGDKPETPKPKEPSPKTPKKPKAPASSSRPLMPQLQGDRLAYTPPNTSPRDQAEDKSDTDTTPTISVDTTTGQTPLAEISTIPARPTFSGTAEPGSVVAITLSHQSQTTDSITCTTTANEDGDWSCTLEENLSEGSYTIATTITSTDGSVVELDTYEAEVLGVQSVGEQAEAKPTETESSRWPVIVAAIVAIIVVWLIVAALIRQRRGSATS